MVRRFGHHHVSGSVDGSRDIPTIVSLQCDKYSTTEQWHRLRCCQKRG